MAGYHKFDQGSIDVKVGEQFEIAGRFPSFTDQRRVSFLDDAFKVLNEREGEKPESLSGFGACSPWGGETPMVYTLEALREGTFNVEYQYCVRPGQVHNADNYVVNVKK